MGGKLSAEKAAKKKKEKEDREAIRRQKIFEALEYRQTWNFVFGEEIPKKKKEVYQIVDITPRDVWMEHLYIFRQITALRPDEMFHNPEVYALKWTPPGSSFKVMIPLDDPPMQENVIRILGRMGKRRRKQVLFFFAPQNPAVSMFAPRVHPASLVSYRERNDVLRKLCSQFLEGRIHIEEFQSTLASGYDVWKMVVYNMLPEDEQVYHKYLTYVAPVTKSGREIEAEYLADQITLQEFHDLKFPERKKQKDLEALTYPRPYDSGPCIIKSIGCNGKGIIRCPACENMVCTDCIIYTFLDEATREGCFLLMHRKYCLLLGSLPKIRAVVALEPAYLRELRNTGRAAVVTKYMPKVTADGEVVEEDEEETEEERLLREELQRQKEQEEHDKMMRECPPELARLQHLLEARTKKFEKLKKEIMQYQEKIDEPGHTDMFVERLQRLKDEEVAKVNEHVVRPVEIIQEHIAALGLSTSSTSARNLEAAEKILKQCSWLASMTKVEDFHKAIEEYETQIKIRKREEEERRFLL